MKNLGLFTLRLIYRTRQACQYSSLNICIVGSGPAGFYCAQRLLKNLPTASIDIYEKYPVPFGLVRFGVAPDHPEVKNVVNTFTKTGSNPRVRFAGNVTLGKNIFLKELRDFYHIVVLTYGADNDVELNIPGEELNNVISARKFVGWYNGLPECKDLSVDLQTDTLVILGQGNVALDVARILLKTPDELKDTDITEYALSELAESKIKHVYIVGRRGPLQVSFTIKELREMINLPNVQTVINKGDMDGINITELPRPRKRLTELMVSILSKKAELSQKFFHVKFFRSPIKICGNASVEQIEFSLNRLKTVDNVQIAESTNEREILDCGLVFRSIGYKRVSVDADISTDAIGRINEELSGVILSTMTNAFATADSITKDIEMGKVNLSTDKFGYPAAEALLKERGVCIVDWQGWRKIDSVEVEMGRMRGKPREKIVDVDKMLQITNQ